MSYQTGIRLFCVAQNPANGFPARLLGEMVRSALSIDAERLVLSHGCPLCHGLRRKLLVAKQLLGENHPEGEQSDKGSGGNYGYHLGIPPNSLWS